MPAQKIPINGQTYEGFSVDANAQRTINWFVEADPSGLNNLIQYPTPGSVLFAQTTANACRGLQDFGGDLYTVTGDKLYKVTEDGIATHVGTLNTLEGRVRMAESGQELMIVDGTNGYLWDGTTFSTITDADYPDAANWVAFLDGFFIVNDPAQISTVKGSFYISGVYDGSTWTAVDVSTAERDSDDLLAITTVDGNLQLIGERTIEPWYNSQNADFPYENIRSAVVDWGTRAAHSVVSNDNKVIFLARGKRGGTQVRMLEGQHTHKISSSALDNAIAGYTQVDTAYAFIFSWKGHEFYSITFPYDNVTWLYDMTSNLWTEWSTNGLGEHFSNAHAYFANKHIVGSSLNGKLFELSDDTYLDDTTTIRRVRRTPTIHAQGRYLFHRRLQVVVETGVGTVSIEDPQIMMRYSDDGGRTWSNEKWRSLGNVGEFTKTVFWTNLGRSKRRIYEFVVTDGVKAVIIDGYLNVDGGSYALAGEK